MENGLRLTLLTVVMAALVIGYAIALTVAG